MYLKVKKPYGNELKPILENTTRIIKNAFFECKNSKNS